MLKVRSRALEELDRNEEALGVIDRAVERRPEDYDLLVRRARVLEKLDRHDEAIAACERAIALRPDRIPAHFIRGYACEAKGGLEASLASYTRVTELDPGREAAATGVPAAREPSGSGDALDRIDETVRLGGYA